MATSEYCSIKGPSVLTLTDLNHRCQCGTAILSFKKSAIDYHLALNDLHNTRQQQDAGLKHHIPNSAEVSRRLTESGVEGRLSVSDAFDGVNCAAAAVTGLPMGVAVKARCKPHNR